MSKIKKIKRSALKALLFIYNILFNNSIRETDAGRETVAATVRKVVVVRTAVVDITHIVRIRRINATQPVIPITTTIISLTIFILFLLLNLKS